VAEDHAKLVVAPQIMKPIMHESASNKKLKLVRNESDVGVDTCPKGFQFDETESLIKGALSIITNKVVAGSKIN
jgi:hypothetical protein